MTLSPKSPEVWDATKLSWYLDCEMYGHLAGERHLQPSEPNEALAFGVGFHKAVEVWTQQTINFGCHGYLGNPLEKAKIAFKEVWEQELPQELREKLEFEGNRRSYANFCRLFEAYTRKFPLQMYDEIVAVEIPFTLYLGHTPDGVDINWSGRLDRVVRWQGELYYVDVKTSSYPCDEKFFNQFRFSGQMLGYSWVGRELGLGDFAGIMIHGIEVKAPPKTARGRTVEELIQADIIPIYPDHIEGWRRNTLQKIDDIHRARKREWWVMNMGHACNNFNGCSMRRICSAPEELREQRISEHYRVREWNPLESR